MYTASTKQSENLSQSALSYLQSLEKATKALRQNQTLEKKRKKERKKTNSGSFRNNEVGSSKTSKRGSLSMMISELRQKTQRESTIEESDDDKSTLSRQSQRHSGQGSSSDTPSVSGERVMLDFSFDGSREDSKQIDSSTRGFPGLVEVVLKRGLVRTKKLLYAPTTGASFEKGKPYLWHFESLQMGKKSISELRELRSSIDHSLIKPPKLQRQQPRRQSIASAKESCDRQNESDDENELKTPKQKIIKAKSPFRSTVESGSDIESIDFEDDLPKSKSVRFEDSSSKFSTNSSRTISSRSSASSKSSSSKSSSSSKTSSASSSSSSTSSATVTSKSKASSKSSSKSASSKKRTKDVDVDASSGSSTTVRGYASDFDSISTNSKTSESATISSDRSSIVVGSSSKENNKGKDTKNVSLNSKLLEESETKLSRRLSPPRHPEKKKSDKTRKTSVRSSPSFLSLQRSQANVEPSLQTTSDICKSELGAASSREQTPPTPTVTTRQMRPVSINEHGTQTEERDERHYPEFCSSNVHHVTSDVLQTHMQLLKDFHRMEWLSLQEWNAILDDIREKYDGPSTQKLKAIIEKRAKHIVTKY